MHRNGIYTRSSVPKTLVYGNKKKLVANNVSVRRDRMSGNDKAKVTLTVTLQEIKNK